jgi:hypothetical protein
MNSRVSSSLTLVYANDIDDSGVIVGGAFNPATGASPGFVAIPVTGLDSAPGER